MAESRRIQRPYIFEDVVQFNSTVQFGSGANPTIEFGDDDKLTFGDDNDQAMVNRSSSLSANTSLSGVLIGTPAVTAIPANSLIVSNVTADGDQVFATVPASGSNSIEWLRNDASAGITIFNDAAGDIDFRVEGDNNANMIVSDAGTDSLALGSAVVAGAGLSISNLTGRTTVTSVGIQVHVPSATYNDTGAMGTIAVMADAFVGQGTHTGTNARTYTDSSSLYLAGPPVASTNVTMSNRPQTLTVAAGKSSFTPTATVASAASADLTGIAIPATTITLTGTTQVTAAQGLVNIAQATLTDGSAVTVDTYASLYIANAPTQGGMVTLSTGYALWVDAGTVRLDGTTLILGGISYTVPPDDGDAGEQLQTNGSGVLTWESAASMRQFKDVLGRLDPRDALRRIEQAGIYAFRYRKPAEGERLMNTGDFDTEYTGVMADEAPWAMHHKGKIFSPISAFGHAAAAIQALASRVSALEGRA